MSTPVQPLLLQPIYKISEVSVGQHLYWQLGSYQIHGQSFNYIVGSIRDYNFYWLIRESRFKDATFWTSKSNRIYH